jgi:LEA14-like dessication related protein
MKRGGLLALGLLLLGFVGAFIWYNQLKTNAAKEPGPYDNTLKPRLELSTITITGIDDDAIQMTVRMLIDNPLPVGFKANNLRYTVFMAKTPVVEEAYAKPIAVEPGDSTFVTLPITVKVQQLDTVLKTLDRKGIDSTTYGVRAAFDLDVPILGERTYTQTFEKRLPTFYVPRLTIEDLDFGKMGLKRADVAARIRIENRNTFPLQFTDTRYTVSIDGNEVAGGHQPEPVNIRAQATTPVVFPVTMKPGQTLRLLPKLLFAKKDTPFLVTIQTKLASDDMSLKNSPMNISVRGRLADIAKKR